MKRRLLFLILVCSQVTGCGHAFWAQMRDDTQLAGFVNSLGFALHVAATIGERATRNGSGGPVDLDDEKEARSSVN